MEKQVEKIKAKQVKVKVKIYHCPHCSLLLEGNEKFCPDCGNEVKINRRQKPEIKNMVNIVWFWDYIIPSPVVLGDLKCGLIGNCG